MDAETLFLTTASENNLAAVRLMMDSLRAFGGELAEVPFWVFATDPEAVRLLEGGNTRLLPLPVREPAASYFFGRKVAACARAEELAPAGTTALVWVDAPVLFTQPPVLFRLGAEHDAAFRPVHIRNVGLPPSEPLDAFWKGITAAVGVDEIRGTVTSFVDEQVVRTYYNSSAFAIRPGLGLMRRWEELFQQLAGEAQFQSTACADEQHQIFLFQALLGTLVNASVKVERVRILPPTYNYPYNLQDRIPTSRQFAALNEAVCFTYEDLPIRPEALVGTEAYEPLRSWLEART